MSHPVGAFIHNRGRGEPMREHQDNLHSYQNRSLQRIIDILKDARRIVENHNAKPMAINSPDRGE
jgi:hypothetical protein